MQERNRRLADHSAVCICYLTNPKSGTAYTANYARQQGLRVINLAAGCCDRQMRIDVNS